MPESTKPKPPKLSIQNGHFIDRKGRVCILRGVNLGGSSKLPTNYNQFDQHSNDTSNFITSEVSFVNRPFPLSEAEVHLSRLRQWGLTFIRLVITWEAIEHSGPGIYDVEYLDYIKALVTKAKEYNLLIYIDPHQDVWSRFTGGSGAPLWTLEAIGFNPQNFEITKAALCAETCCDTVEEYPFMIWPTNYFKYACATMFTLFWGGDVFAPNCFVDGIPVQQFLQGHYVNAIVELARCLEGLENVVGFGTMNEPGSGYIGVEDISTHRKTELRYGYAPTSFQGMVLSEGFSQDIGFYSNGIYQHLFNLPDYTKTINPHKARAWKEGYNCPWLKEGVWDVIDNKPTLLKPDYFSNYDFGKDFYVPFAKRFTKSIHSIFPHSLIFCELVSLEFSTCEFPMIDTEYEVPNAVNASHWYDPITYFSHRWIPYFTVDPRSLRPYFCYKNVKWLHTKMLNDIKMLGTYRMNNAPTLIGETGIPFDLRNGQAFVLHDYSEQVSALDHTISCLESNLLSYTLWCYTSDNDHVHGDQWNKENFSIIGPNNCAFSEGGRAIEAFVRPFAIAINGIPIQSEYDRQSRCFELQFQNKKNDDNLIKPVPTIVYFPNFLYRNTANKEDSCYSVSISDGTFEIQSKGGDDDNGWDEILYYHDEGIETHSFVLNLHPSAMVC